jgi:hypothetical protein
LPSVNLSVCQILTGKKNKIQVFVYFYKAITHIKKITMKKLFLLATAAMFITGATFAEVGGKKKGKKKSCAKGKTCGSMAAKSCCKDKEAKTAKL